MQITSQRLPRARGLNTRDVVRRGASILALAVVYAAVGRIGLAIGPVQSFATLVWPPTGVALAALLLVGAHLWPGVALGAFLVNVWIGAPVSVAVGISLGNTLEAVVGAHLIRRAAGPGWSIERLRDVLGFIVLAALLSTALSATVGVATLFVARLVRAGDVAETWRVWWLGDAVGDLVVASLLLAWRESARRALATRRRAEAAVLSAALIAAAVFVFFHSAVAAATGFVHACMLIPLLMWAAVRFGMTGATAAVFIASAIAVAGTASGLGPFVQDSVSSSLLHQQAFMAIVAAAVLIVGAVTAERDVTLRRCELTEKALRESEERLRRREYELRRITDVTPLMLLRCGRDLRYRFVNRAYAQLLGRTPEQLVGTAIAEMLGAEGFKVIRPHIESVLQGRTVAFEAELRLEGVGVRSFQAVYIPEPDDQGQVTGWVASIVDITEWKKAEEALRDADRRKNEFLSVLSHELRNPLAPIRNSLHILQRAPDGSEQAFRAKAVIERQTLQLTRLVEDLLDVTRISRGKIKLHRGRVELTTLVRNTVEDHRLLFSSRDIVLDLSVDAEPRWIKADATRVRQIVGNLLQNAARFTNAHGHVTVRVGQEAQRVVIRVADDGIGMSPELLTRIFEPFTQADSSLDRSLGGLGLGLALVKRLVEMHGGEVEARSEGAGRGSEFTVRMPLLDSIPVAPQSIPARSAGIAARRVLIIEDNLDAAESLKEGLEMSGHEVVVAHDGEEGLAQARSLRPEVVLCDIGLPGLNGYEVARRIRADPLLSPVLIAVTGYALPEDQRKAREAGFDRHLAKPFEFREIEEAVANARATLARRRILVVDDNDAMRSSVRELLEDGGWEVEEARDGPEALDAVARRAPAVVLLDYRMPGMDGGEVARRIAAAGATLQVVLMTASADVREVAMLHGLRFYVPKPFAPHDLLGTIAQAAAAA